jgi:hypothetical protein
MWVYYRQANANDSRFYDIISESYVGCGLRADNLTRNCRDFQIMALGN